MLYATVRQRKIHVKNPVTVIQNGVGVDMLTLDMDDEWREMTSIVCVFTTKYTVQEEKPKEEDDTETDGENTPTPLAETEEGTEDEETNEEETEMITVEKEIAKEVLHTFGEPILVPWENLTETGLLSVSCTGYVGGNKIMTTMMPDSFWNIVQNGPKEGDETLEPTPSLYDQVIAAAGEAQAAAKAANDVAVDLRIAKENGEFDGSDGVTPTITIGSVVTGVPGGEAKVTAEGTPGNVVLNFTIPRGIQGTPGVPGSPGVPGRDGIDGSPGKDGKDGVNGKDGYTPVKGVDYFDGKDGVDGKDGKDGTDASVTTESITKALGYTPVNGKGGTSGQFAVSDGKGGIAWVSLTNVGEVGA